MSILRRIGTEIQFTMTELAIEIDYPRSTMGAAVRGDSPGRLNGSQRAALVRFLEERRARLDALLLEIG